MKIDVFADYSGTVVKQLEQVIFATPEVLDATFETTSAFKSVRQIIHHLVGAAERWTGRLVDQMPATLYETRAPEDIAQVFQDWKEIQARLFSAVRNEAAIDRAVEWQLPSSSVTLNFTGEDCVLQLVNHCTYHVGQIVMILQRMGQDPPNFDYILIGLPDGTPAGQP